MKLTKIAYLSFVFVFCGKIILLFLIRHSAQYACLGHFSLFVGNKNLKGSQSLVLKQCREDIGLHNINMHEKCITYLLTALLVIDNLGSFLLLL